jgi:hypothetical protein
MYMLHAAAVFNVHLPAAASCAARAATCSHHVASGAVLQSMLEFFAVHELCMVCQHCSMHQITLASV